MERGEGGTRQARHEQSEIKTANPTDFIGRGFASVFALSGSGGKGTWERYRFEKTEVYTNTICTKLPSSLIP